LRELFFTIPLPRRIAPLPEENQVPATRALRLFFSRLLGLKPAPKPKRDRVRLRITSNGEYVDAEDPRISDIRESKGYKSALALLSDAVRLRADQVFIEPAQDDTNVAFRIDGMKESVSGFGRSMGDSVIGVFKELAHLDREEKRKPQEGRFAARADESRAIEFHVTSSGTTAGEKLTLRVFDQERGLLMLSELGMVPNIREAVHDLVRRRIGLFVVCGPLDSGMTTTLNACLAEIDRYQLNAVALGAGAGIRVPNVAYREMDAKGGRTIAAELPAVLRAGLDVLCIGELGDAETADLACKTAKDGKMVLVGLEASDTVTGLGTILDLGVKPSLLRGTLTAVLAQRLVRLLCRRCRVRYKPDREMLRKANLPADQIKFFYRPPEPPLTDEGADAPVCEYCGGSGYRERTGVFEMLVVNERIREMIREDADLYTIKQEAIKHGMRRLQEEAMQLVMDGKTSIQELIRVCS
jgi:type II secretory ATPase GspE/PulE/Tfp pilus assembly ATPase PilB-like protein